MQRMRAIVMLTLLTSSVAWSSTVPLPARVQALSGPSGSHAFLAADHQAVPLDLAAQGYVEEELLVAGNAGIYDWPDGREPVARAHGPYVTRILVRRPRDARKFSGTVIVEGLNPSTPVDLPIMWGHSYRQFIADGHAWVGVTVKPNIVRSLRRFDPARYGELVMAHPPGGPECAQSAIHSWSQPSTPAEETGLAWDILSQVGALLKSGDARNPLHRPAQLLYMTGQSQTAGYARTYASVFARYTHAPTGRPLYDGFLYSGSPPWQVPLHQCVAGFADEDPRSRTAAAGVPVIELFAEGDIGPNIISRRADSDKAPDLYRRYEVAGAAHADAWEARSFADAADFRRATGQGPDSGPSPCQPVGVQDTDFPARHAIDVAWRHLDVWVRSAKAPPRAKPLQLRMPVGAPFDPEQAFVTDGAGNAMGGVRSPLVDVPVARYIGAKTGAFVCMFDGYMYPFGSARLRELYGSGEQYLRQVQASARALRRQGWLTSEDEREILADARNRSVVFQAAGATAPAEVSPAVREYRLHMFDPPVSTLANRTIELMFETRTVPAGKSPWKLPSAPRLLDFQYMAGGKQLAAEGFAERTFTDALLIMKDGRIVHERYLNRATERTRFNSYSMAKSFNSIMAGIAIAEGRIGSVDEPVLKYMPELKGTAYDGLTLKHLLAMRTGARWDDNFFSPGPSRDAHLMAFVEARARYVSAAQLIKERAGPPGVAFNYNSVEAALVGEIVSRATGENLSRYLSTKLWQPAGMESDAFYMLDGPPDVGREFTAGGFNATLRDYARVGQMMLERGRANGRQILPAAWVEESTRPGPGHGSVEDGTGYAYLWWTLDGTRAFTMLGGEGQFVFVDPDTHTVVVKMSHIPVGSEGAQATAESFAFLKAAAAWRPAQ